MITVNFTQYEEQHIQWVKAMGWWGNKTFTEEVALISSEVGVAMNEFRGDGQVTKEQGYELADIILRVMVLYRSTAYYDENPYLLQEVPVLRCVNVKQPLAALLTIQKNVVMHLWKKNRDEISPSTIQSIIGYVAGFADRLDIDIEGAVFSKIQENIVKGKKPGRLK